MIGHREQGEGAGDRGHGTRDKGQGTWDRGQGIRVPFKATSVAML